MKKKQLNPKQILIKLSPILLVTCLSACNVVPSPPEIDQCGYSFKFQKFRCCDTKSGNCINVKLDDSLMEGAQCVSAEDFKKSSDYVDTLKQLAETHCH